MNQVLAVVWVRYRLLINALRSRVSGLEFLAAILVFLAVLVASLGIAALLGMIVYSPGQFAVPEWKGHTILATFWVVTLLGLVVPLLLSTGRSGLDTSQLIGFPIRRRKLFGLTLSSAFLSPDHVFYYPTLITTFVTGIVLAGGPLWVSLLAFLVIPCQIVVWGMAVITLLQGVLRNRRGKEMASLIGFGIFVLVSLLPAFVTNDLRSEKDDPAFIVELGESLAWCTAFTPPNLATEAIRAGAAGDLGGVARAFALQLVWLIAGLAAAYQTFVRVALRVHERGGSARGKGERGVQSSFDITEKITWIPAEVLAVASKELRYLLRSSVGRFNLIMIGLFPVLGALIFVPMLDGPRLLGHGEELTLYGLLLYTLLFTNNFVNNCVGWEGVGFKSYLLAPVPFQRVLVGKNLGVWVYSMMLLAISLGVWSALVGFPGFDQLTAGLLFFAIGTLLFSCVGNFVSLGFPVARDISKMKSQPSQPAVFLSLLTVIGLAVLLGFPVILPLLLDFELPRFVPLLVLLPLALLGYRLSLGPAAELFHAKREQIIAKLEDGD